ncbi:hypothetical protein [Natrarchaeobius oligotrophus]|uniref:Uncharacterized protein n=1 Tax=Natrarchaeobius chitinivorans TaxID=1679083 RepID=A0A3N6MT07_NATCH|nr:hypothetical protein [Natrarchaeobius chitinivorans]RQG99481.1 hypothetical protein EA472_14775 [Natrarchaeobius chitinivorans]
MVTPIAVRYETDRDHAIWLIPIGGLWGLVLDVHHVAPVFERELYAIHNSPWADLFAFHYTLDRQAVRTFSLERIFVSIVLFIGAVAIFWGTRRLRPGAYQIRTGLDRVIGAGVTTVIAASYATVAMGVAVSVQEGFRSVSTIVGNDSTLVGGIVVGAIGIGLGLLCGLGLEGIPGDKRRTRPSVTALGGGAFGVMVWLGGVGIGVPLRDRFLSEGNLSIPFIHWGGLVALVVYGATFGVAYGIVRGVFQLGEPRQPLKEL